jgi:hypothetical protein
MLDRGFRPSDKPTSSYGLEDVERQGGLALAPVLDV